MVSCCESTRELYMCDIGFFLLFFVWLLSDFDTFIYVGCGCTANDNETIREMKVY
jgi:hypothetical protein